MIRIKDELDIGDSEDEWKMLWADSDHLWVLPRENRFVKGRVINPCPYEMLDHLKLRYNNPMVVPHISLFENNNGLSTQVPMKHIYYTDCKELCEWSGHLGYIRLVFSENMYELKRYQNLVLKILNK